MKRLPLSLLFLLALHLTASEVRSQVQRLAIPPQSFSLSAKGASHDVRAYCLDRHLFISDPTPFTDVLAGDAKVVKVGNLPRMTLKQALDRKLIAVQGAGTQGPDYSRINGTQLKFTSNSDAPITIDFKQIVAMGERGASPVAAQLLVPVRKFQSEAEFKKVQDEVWWGGIEESRLEALGFYGSGRVVRNSFTTQKAVQAFQQQFELQRRDGTFDDVTRLALSQVERQQIATFEQLGFRVRRTDTNVPSVTDNIRAFEEFLRPEQKPTSKLSVELRAELRQFADQYGTSIKQALKVDAAHALPSDRSIMANNPNVLTFQKASYFIEQSGRRVLRSETAVMLKNPDGVELVSIQNGNLSGIATGERAIAAFEDTASYFAALGFNSHTLGVRAGIYKPGGKVSLQLGAKQIKLSESEMAGFLAGELKHPELDAAFEKLLAAGGASRPRVIIFRSPFAQGRGGNAEDGGALLTQFGYKQHDPLKLALAIERYDDKFRDQFDVIIASDIERGLTNLERLPGLVGGSQIGLYVDGQLKQSSKIIKPIEKDVKKAGIKVLNVGGDPSAQTRIFLFAGHRDEAAQQLVLRLADEGHFRNGVVALAVCGGGKCDAQFNSLLISRSGARAVIFYNQEIKAQAVQDVILKFSEMLAQEGAPKGNYQELWRRSVDAVEREATTNARNEVRKLRDIIIQVSTLRRKSRSPNAE